jgi:uncharacterized protein (TIGR00369 family)
MPLATRPIPRADEAKAVAPRREMENRMLTIESTQSLLEKLLPGLMGVQIVELAADRVVAEMKVREDLCTTGQVLHGGAYMALADTLGAVGTMMNLPPGKRTATTDSSTKFIAAARLHSIVRGECIALHRGRTTMVWQTSVSSEDGKLCALVTQTQLVLDA